MEIINVIPDGAPTLEPGVYENIPADLYFRLPYASQSTIKAVWESTEQYEHNRDRGERELSAEEIRKLENSLYFGRWYHTYVLEMDQFHTTYREGPAKRQSTADKDKYRALAEEAGGYERVYRPQHLEKMKWMLNVLMGYDVPRKLFQEDGRPELTIVWDEEIMVGETRVLIRCKARIDRYNNHRKAGIDLKTDANLDILFNSNKFFRLFYHMQAAFYQRALIAGGMVCHWFIYIVQQKSSPYIVRYKMIGEDVLDRGWVDAKKMLSNYGAYLQTGFQQPQLELMELPAWMEDLPAGKI